MPKLKQEKLDLKALIGIDHTKNPIPCIVPEVEIPIAESKTQGRFGGGKVYDKFLLVKVSKGYYGPESLMVMLIKPGELTARSFTIPVTFEINKLTGIPGMRMVKSYEKQLANDFRHQLGHQCNIGSDPEIFVTDEKDTLIPAFEFLGGKKDTKVRTVNGNSPVYWDGFQAEFETLAGSCLDNQCYYVYEGMNAVLRAARKYNKKAKLSLKTVMEIPSKLLQESKDEHVALGCMPSFNAYDMHGQSVENGRDMPIRSTGGHIHFGLFDVDTIKKEQYIGMVKALDAILGVACVSLFAEYDNAARRQYYGLAGEYRLPKHGLEYRPLSNAWLAHPFITNIVFMLARKAMMVGKVGLLEKVWDATEKETIDCINNHDVEKAREILKRNKDSFIEILEASVYTGGSGIENGKILYKVFMEGMHEVIKTPEDIEGNWNLTGTAENRFRTNEHNKAHHTKYRDAKVDLSKGKKVA